MRSAELPTPPRPDLRHGPLPPPRRELRSVLPPRRLLIAAAAVVLPWLAGSLYGLGRIGFYPPDGAKLLFAFGWIPVLGGALLLARTKARPVAVGMLAVFALIFPTVASVTIPGVRQLEETPIPGAPTLVVSAAPEGNPDLWLLRDGGAETIRLTDTPQAEIDAALSPSGARVAYAVDSNGDSDIWVATLSVDGALVDRKQLTALEGDERSPSWSPNGAQIVYVWVHGGASDLRIANYDGGGSQRTITYSDSDWAPAWSPDGGSIAFSRMLSGHRDIWVYRLETGSEAAQIDVPGNSDETDPIWSPDGSHLAWSSNARGDWDTYVSEPFGTGTLNLTFDPDADDIAYGWSPDGAYVLFVSDRAHAGGSFLYFVPAGGGEPTLVSIL